LKRRWNIALSLALVAASLALALGPRFWGQPPASQQGDVNAQLQWISQAINQGQAAAAGEQGTQLLQQELAPAQAGLVLLLMAQAGLALADQGQEQDLARLRLFLADASRLGAWSPAAWQALLRLEARQPLAPADPAALQEEFVSLQESLASSPPDYPQLQAKSLRLQALLEASLFP